MNVNKVFQIAYTKGQMLVDCGACSMQSESTLYHSKPTGGECQFVSEEFEIIKEFFTNLSLLVLKPLHVLVGCKDHKSPVETLMGKYIFTVCRLCMALFIIRLNNLNFSHIYFAPYTHFC